MNTTRVSFVLGVVACFILVLSALAYAGCNQPGNLVANCNFDSFTGAPPRQVPQGWTPWTLMGNPAFDQDNHGSAPGAPALRIWSDWGTWTAGVYQQVGATPGKGYKAWVEWSPPQCPQKPGCLDIERRIGIDPTGGTDPGSPRIVWGPSMWDDAKMGDVHVNAYAQSQTITVFLWTHHPVSHGQDQVYFDSVILVEDPSMVPPTKAPTNTPTRRPPTKTPKPVAAKATDTPVPPTDTPLPTDTPTLTPTNTATPTWTPSATPTNTPTPTWTPTLRPLTAAELEAAQARATSRLVTGEERQSAPRWLLMVAIGAVLLAGIAGTAGVLLWMSGAIGRRQ